MSVHSLLKDLNFLEREKFRKLRLEVNLKDEVIFDVIKRYPQLEYADLRLRLITKQYKKRGRL